MRKSCFFSSSKGKENSRKRKNFTKSCRGNIHEARGLFRTESSICDGAFCENI